MVRLNKIYTRTGDTGSTSLVSGQRVPKYDLRIAAYGTVDETNACIGLARHHAAAEGQTGLDAMLARIQNDLFDLGADLATPRENTETPGEALRITQGQVDRLESEIDALNGALAPLKSFVLPGGTATASMLHLARTICRRAERLISGHNILVYLALAAVPATWWVLFRTRFGLRLRAVGENPGAVDTAGISVVRLRYAAVLICGLLCGIAGAYLSTGMAAGFVREMTAGKGFIALAALIFAKWRPWPALGACLLFGFLEAIGIRYQGITIGSIVIPVQFMQALPYILTVVILAGFVGKAVPPKAGGRPYVKER